MALKGLDIFKLSPKTNCKECGNPTCMAFSMKVAQGAVSIDACPYMSEEAKKLLSEATQPPMATLSFGTGENEHKLGGETVLFRHDKTFVSRSVFGVSVCPDCFDKKWVDLQKVDYERIGERMHVETLYLCLDSASEYDNLTLVQKDVDANLALILDTHDLALAEKALELCKDLKPILNAATPANYAEATALAQKYNVLLGVSADSLDALHDTVEAIEGLGYKNLVLDTTFADARGAFEGTVCTRRAAIKDSDHTFGYPSLVNVAKLAPGDSNMQTALASAFILKYGSIIIMDNLTYAEALPLFGLRQNIFTDPQKPMRVAPGVYPINGADNTAVLVTTVDFALTYFIVSGELERSGVKCNLMISDAGGYSVLTSWAAGKFSAGSISRFIQENNIEEKYTSRTLIIPGKVAVLKGELQEKLPGWNIVVAPNDATSLVKFMKSYQ